MSEYNEWFEDGRDSGFLEAKEAAANLLDNNATDLEHKAAEIEKQFADKAQNLFKNAKQMEAAALRDKAKLLHIQAEFVRALVR